MIEKPVVEKSTICVITGTNCDYITMYRMPGACGYPNAPISYLHVILIFLVSCVPSRHIQ